MKTFKVYKHPIFGSEVIQSGVPVAVIILTMMLTIHFWMLYKRLWTQFWIWTIYAASILYLRHNGQLQEWVLSNDSVGYWIFGSILIYLIYPFIYANTWLESQLEQEGYELIDTVVARNKKRAIQIAENNYYNPGSEEGDEDELEQLEVKSTGSNTILLIVIAILIASILINIL